MLRHKTLQQGVTLVEAMIALLVISIGLLGIASLQITAMTQNASSLHHSQAVWYAYNMSDRIRANISEFDNYADQDTDVVSAQDCESNPCSTSDMIDADIADWAQMVQNLPGGRGTIVQADDADDGLLVRVMWDDEGDGVTGIGCNPASAADMTCYELAVDNE